MDSNSPSEQLTDLSNYSAQLSFIDALTILIFAFLAGIFIKYLFRKYSNTFSSKVSIGNTLLILTITVASIIAVVKTSLALSLGLVGALSVVRFRTAIKEPYNLSFLLLSICLGISIGASQYMFSIMVCITALISLIYLSRVSTSNKKSHQRKNLIALDEIDTINLILPSNSSLTELENVLNKSTEYYSIVSFDQSFEKSISVVIRIQVTDITAIEKAKATIFKSFPGSSFTFYNSPSN